MDVFEKKLRVMYNSLDLQAIHQLCTRNVLGGNNKVLSRVSKVYDNEVKSMLLFSHGMRPTGSHKSVRLDVLIRFCRTVNTSMLTLFRSASVLVWYEGEMYRVSLMDLLGRTA